MPWSTPFDDPIVLRGGRKLATLQQAADYIMQLPEDVQKLDPKLVGVLLPLLQSTPLIVVGYRGASNVEKKGWIGARVKSILFALTGMVGFYAGLKMASGDPAA